MWSAHESAKAVAESVCKAQANQQLRARGRIHAAAHARFITEGGESCRETVRHATWSMHRGIRTMCNETACDVYPSNVRCATRCAGCRQCISCNTQHAIARHNMPLLATACNHHCLPSLPVGLRCRGAVRWLRVTKLSHATATRECAKSHRIRMALGSSAHVR